MSFYNFFHTFFGNIDGEDYRFRNNADKNENSNDGSDRDSPGDDIERDVRDFFFDFEKMTDPFQLHDFLMKSMNDVFKASAVDLTDLFSGLGEFKTQPPAIKENLNPRDLYLKPEFNKSAAEENNVKEGGHHVPGNSRTWTSSYRKTVTLSDGTVKTEEVIRNADGTVKRTESTSSLDENNLPQVPYPSFDFSGIWGQPDVPLTIQDPKYNLLKPGYENSNSNPAKIDKDLDEEVSLTGFENLPSFSKDPLNSGTEKGLSCTIKTITTHNGVTETKEIVKIPDRTEEKVETHSHEPKRSGFFGLNAKELQDIVDLLFR